MGIIYEKFKGGDVQVRADIPLRSRSSESSDLISSQIGISAKWQASGESADLQIMGRLVLAAVLGDVSDGRFVCRIPFDASLDSTALDPSVTTFSSSLHTFRVQFLSAESSSFSINGRLDPGVALFEGDGAFRTSLRYGAYFTDSAVQNDRRAFMVQRPVLRASVAAGVTLARFDQFSLSAIVAPQHIMGRGEQLHLKVNPPLSLLDGFDVATDRLTLADVTTVIWQMLHSEGLQLTDSATFAAGRLVAIAEALALSAGAGTLLDALSTTVSALGIGATRGYTVPMVLAEQLALTGDPAGLLLALARAGEKLALRESAVGGASLSVLVSDDLALGDAATSTAQLLNLITEGFEVLMRFELPGGEYVAWVCNTETRAFTRYRNFPFNSFCELGGHYYGATDEGIYLLEGDDDAGEPIEAYVRTGLMDMGTGLMKRNEALYLGYCADGQMLLKVITTSELGEKTESWYSLDPQPAAAPREGRIKIGRGLKSVYWGFEIANVNGADFALDTVKFLPMILERRI